MRLFPGNLATGDWVSFPAEGYRAPVTGVIFRDGKVHPGMPLGGLGTGFLSLGTDGTLDYAGTIFNTFNARGVGYQNTRDAVPSYRYPFLAVAVEGKVSLLSTAPAEGVQKAKVIEYWGHYPVADIEYDLDLPLKVGLRAWTPFLPGCAAESNTPGSVFEMHLRNRDAVPHKVTVAASFAGRVAKTLANGRRFSDLCQDPAFTMFIVGTMRALEGAGENVIGWGDSSGPGKDAVLRLNHDTASLEWSAGMGTSVRTAPESFREFYDTPVVICVQKVPGPLRENTRIWVNGKHLCLQADSSRAIPDIRSTGLRFGDNRAATKPGEALAEVILYDRALPAKAVQAIGYYCAEKYDIDASFETPGPDWRKVDGSPVPPGWLSGLRNWFVEGKDLRAVPREEHVGFVLDDQGDECATRRENEEGRTGETIHADVIAYSVSRRTAVKGDVSGILVEGRRGTDRADYLLGMIGDMDLRHGGEITDVPELWNDIASALPSVGQGACGASIAADLTVPPGETRVVRLVLAWHAPTWKAFNRYENMYASRFGSALDVAQYLSRTHEELLERVLAWQQVIYGTKELPGWLQDSLINVLAVLPQESFMLKSQDSRHWWGEEGFFCVNESMLSCSQMACIANDSIGEWAINLLFPDLGLRKLEAFRHYQKSDTGQPPSTLGGGPEPDHPWFDQQLAYDGQAYIHLADRYRLATGDVEMLHEWYPSVKACMEFMQTIDKNGDGVPDVEGANHYLDAWNMRGIAIHIAMIWLCTIRIVERMADLEGDGAYADKMRALFDKAYQSTENALWDASGDTYLLYRDVTTGDRSETVICDQLIGETYARLHGVDSILPAERVARIVSTLERLNLTPYGIRLASRRDGGTDECSYYSPFIVPSYSTLFAATGMVLTSDAHYRQMGPDIVRRTWHNMVTRQNMAWDMPCMLKTDGTLAWGMEYYHNTMLWIFPLVVLGQDIATACSPGGFISEIRNAAWKKGGSAHGL